MRRSDEPRGDVEDRFYGFPVGLWRALERNPPPGLGRSRAWHSPLRGPWLTPVFGADLLVALPVVIITGLLDYIAYGPRFGQAISAATGAGWALTLGGPRPTSLTRAMLLAMPQHPATLPIRCVEGWATTQTWTGVWFSTLIPCLHWRSTAPSCRPITATPLGSSFPRCLVCKTPNGCAPSTSGAPDMATALTRVHTLADRSLTAGLRAVAPSRGGGPSRVAAVHYLRVPLLGTGLLFLLFFPGIAQGSQTYLDATGLTQEPYLGRWLLITAAMFLISAVVYAARVAYTHRETSS